MQQSLMKFLLLAAASDRSKNLCQEAIDHCVKAEQKAESYE